MNARGGTYTPAPSGAWAIPAVAAAAAAALYLLGVDHDVFFMLNGGPLGTPAALWACITVLGDGAVVCALCLLFVRRRPDIVFALAVALIATALFVRAGKILVDEKRPLGALGASAVRVIGPQYRERSFPSGHAATVFAVAGVVALGLRRRALSAVVIAAAAIVAVSRVVVGVHWPIDVLAGIAGGWLTAVLGLRCAERWRWALAPPAQITVALLFAAGAFALVAGYTSGYADAAGFMRLAGLAGLAALATTFLSARRRDMDTMNFDLLNSGGAPGRPQNAASLVSIVIPLHDEEHSVPVLVTRVADAMRGAGLRFELICVNDGSRDGTGPLLDEMALTRPWLKPVHLIRNYGQAVALQAGFDNAHGELIVTLDGDLQNDPRDIPGMVDLLSRNAVVDVVSGWRTQRKDGFLLRRLPSLLANRLISAVTGVRLHDYGCALKVYRAQVIRDIRLYGDMHRFIPALAAEVGAHIVEVPVSHFPRTHGVSHYGVGRAFRVVVDLLWVKFLMRFLRRPMHAFGGVGVPLVLGGGATLAYLAFQKLALGYEIGGRPLLLFGTLLTLIGIQLLATGVIGEILIRIYHEPQGRRLYVLRPRPTRVARGAERRREAIAT
jgi:glycosyltransferase involved in cell wall biosynthesis/membrane-associated phospholipid phosphatase